MNLVQPIRDPLMIKKIKDYFLADNERNYMLFVMGINTGLRISDILQLQVKDVTGMHINLREQKTRKRKKIRITPQLRREIKWYVEDKQSDDYLFKSRKGDNQPIGRSMAYKILRKAADKFKLQEIGTHTLRKTFGYHFYLQTKNTAMLQELFNHSSEKITLIYIGINQDTLDKAMSDFKI
ncbi:site-specific integrase [Pontibacillus salipaludis]|uniref:Site-specific integrase n=1 Tax=Pontibacillus salipaludis TaxID=1697394 RepID=A0ABQ1PWQ3_9BACI|nr:site-specific integrase [Pontibacillus salipaludis]GGD05308.1 site-specific integrase [Pontibacillus salipaludis]